MQNLLWHQLRVAAPTSGFSNFPLRAKASAPLDLAPVSLIERLMRPPLIATVFSLPFRYELLLQQA